ncbi:MAG: hypothetical protein N2035_03650 [Chthoniobacterales bacterium]|nr:hypothetical protein [Chthoniobacterales bacterium]
MIQRTTASKFPLANGFSYDFLVVGVGVELNPQSVEDFSEALETPQVGNIYMLDKAAKFFNIFKNFPGERALYTFPPGYVKCGGAPQKICWLSEVLFRMRGI